MLNQFQTLDYCIEQIDYFLKVDKKGNTNISKANSGFTSYANCLNTIKQYAKNGHLSVPTQSMKAQQFLEKHDL